MALAFMILSCFLFYGTSRYFPMQDIPMLQEHKLKIIALAGAISLLSLFLFARSFDLVTGFLVWMLAFMTILSGIILSLKMNTKWIWAWSSLSILSIIIDLI